MGVVKRQGIYISVINYIGVILGYINVAYFLPKYLSPEEVGLRSMLVDGSMILMQFCLFGFPNVFLRYFPYFKDEETQRLKKGFLFFVFIVPSLLLVLFYFFFDYSILEYWFEDTSPLFVNYAKYLYPLVVFFVFTALLDAYYRSLMISAISTFMREIVLRIITILLVLAYGFGWIKLDWFVSGLVLAYGLQTLVLSVYLGFIGKLDFRIDFSWLNRSNLKEMLSFAFYGLLYSSSTYLVLKIDIVMIAGRIDLDAAGIYSIAIFIATVIEIPRRSVMQVVSPIIASVLKKEDHKDELQSIYQKTSINMLIAAAFVFGGLLLCIDDLFMLIPNGETYARGKYVVLLIGLAKVIDMGFSCNGEIVAFSKYYKYNMYFMAFLAIVTIVTNYFFITWYGITGAAMATALSIFLFNLTRFIFLKINYTITPFSFQTVKLILIILATIGITWFIQPVFSPIENILIKGICFSLLYIALIYFSRCSDDFNSLLDKVLAKVISILGLPK